MQKKKRKLHKLRIDLKGDVYGDLTVLRRVRNWKTFPQWRVRCSCGNEITVRQYVLRRKVPKTHCGCKSVISLKVKYKVEYHAWWDAKNRCHRDYHPSYKRYGALGIRMCKRWRDSFENFLKDVGPRPEGLSLDRIDAHGDYKPGNVRWADTQTQARNKKGTKWIIHPDTGKLIKAADYADELGVSYQSMRGDLITRGLWN